MTRPRFLLADEDHDLCWLLSHTLAKAGVDLTTVHDGEAALQRLADQSFDAFVLNLTLPQRLGFELLHQVRSRDAQLPIVILSAIDGELMRRKALALGANGYLTKPFRQDQLMATLSAQLPSADHNERPS